MRQFIKRLLPKSVIQKLIKARTRIRGWWLKALAKSKHLSRCYFAFLSSEFSRENHVVMAGIASHRQRNLALEKINDKSHPRLRRNTHRLEKGLLMQPRKPIFGLAYIDELVSDYLNQSQNLSADKSELQWAHNVLANYFTNVDLSHPKLSALYQEFNQATHVLTGDGKAKPYLRSQTQQHNVSFEDLKSLALQRRSVRWFKDIAVQRELIEKACDIATQAPSACNRQPFRLVIIDDLELKRRAVELPMGTAGWAHNIPVFAVFVGDFSSFEFARDRHVPYIDASLAAMNFMLALETLGLSSCPINWPDIEEREQAMAELLELKPWERPVMCLAIGYADAAGGIAFSQKKTAKHLISYL